MRSPRNSTVLDRVQITLVGVQCGLEAALPEVFWACADAALAGRDVGIYLATPSAELKVRARARARAFGFWDSATELPQHLFQTP